MAALREVGFFDEDTGEFNSNIVGNTISVLPEWLNFVAFSSKTDTNLVNLKLQLGLMRNQNCFFQCECVLLVSDKGTGDLLIFS